MVKNVERPRAAVYVRVSAVGRRDRESARYQTELEQEERCRAYAAAKGYDVETVASDVDVTGARWDRAGLDLVLQLARDRKVSAVIVFRLSRLGRGVRGVLATVDELDQAGVTLLSVSEGVDLSTAQGRLFFNLLASFDEYERELRGEYWAGVKERASARGVLLARTPFGYSRHESGSEAGRLFPDPVLGPVMQTVFSRRAAGETIESLCEHLDDVAPRSGGRLWGTSRLSQALKNRVYLGEIDHDGQVFPGAHEPLVDAATWRLVQSTVALRKNRSTEHDFVLAGIARCASCGGAMTGQARANGKEGSAAYRCKRDRSREPCGAPPLILAGRLEPYVVGLWRDRMNARKADGRSRDTRADEAARLEALWAGADEEVRAWSQDLALRGALGRERWRDELDGLIRQRDALRGDADRALDGVAGGVFDVPLSMVENDPGLLRLALRSEVTAVLVARGRGAVEDRVVVDFADGTRV